MSKLLPVAVALFLASSLPACAAAIDEPKGEADAGSDSGGGETLPTAEEYFAAFDLDSRCCATSPLGCSRWL